MSDQETSGSIIEPSTTRKRKIDHLLGILDRSKFIPSSPIKQSTFAPWDRFSLSARLLSFRKYFNHSLESPINALTLSRYGWQYRGQNTIECIHCHEQLVILVDTRVPEAYAELERRYGDMVVSRHRNTCPWVSKQCDIKLLRIPLADPQLSLANMETRTRSFSGLVDSSVLPKVNLNEVLHLPDLMSLEERYALFGWSIESQGNLSLLVCTECHCRALSNVQDFNLIEAHCAYCPWICSRTQGQVPGYSLLLQHWNISHDIGIVNDTVQKASKSESMTYDADHTEHENPRERVRQVKQKLGFL